MTLPAGPRARLACLLPDLDESAREPVARRLIAHVELSVMRDWTALVRSCADGQPPAIADALHRLAARMPDPEPLLGRLGGAVTPGLILSLPLANRAGVIACLLAHPDAQAREQTLDALADGSASGCGALRRACVAWSRRMLMAELGRIPELSHTDRLGLQERLLAAAGGPSSEGPDLDVPGPDVPGPDVPGPDVPGPDVPDPDTQVRQARILGDALRRAANREATAILAERAGVAAEAAEIAVVLRDPKMLVALCWKAGCDPAEAVAVQVQLGHVPPDQVLRVGPDNRWPLDAAAMRWQIGILEDL